MNEIILEDRLEHIRMLDKKYNLKHNVYISFSGGKDSVVLSGWGLEVGYVTLGIRKT